MRLRARVEHSKAPPQCGSGAERLPCAPDDVKQRREGFCLWIMNYALWGGCQLQRCDIAARWQEPCLLGIATAFRFA